MNTKTKTTKLTVECLEERSLMSAANSLVSASLHPAPITSQLAHTATPAVHATVVQSAQLPASNLLAKGTIGASNSSSLVHALDDSWDDGSGGLPLGNTDPYSMGLSPYSSPYGDGGQPLGGYYTPPASVVPSSSPLGYYNPDPSTAYLSPYLQSSLNYGSWSLFSASYSPYAAQPWQFSGPTFSPSLNVPVAPYGGVSISPTGYGGYFGTPNFNGSVQFGMGYTQPAPFNVSPSYDFYPSSGPSFVSPNYYSH